MQCSDMRNLFFAYLDGELSPNDASSLLDHLTQCPTCAEEFAKVKAFDQAMSDAFVTPQPPTNISELVMTKIHSMNRPPMQVKKGASKPIVFWRSAAALAAAVILVIGVNNIDLDTTIQPNDISNPPGVIEPNGQNNVNPPPVEPEPEVTNPDVQGNIEDQPQNDITNKPSDGNAQQKPTAKPVEPTVPQEPVIPETPDTSLGDQDQTSGTLELPKANYGTETRGAFGTRMMASFEDFDVKMPKVSDNGKTLSFYTLQDSDLLLWSVDTATTAEPTFLGASKVEDSKALTMRACAIYDVNTTIFSPDKTMFAANMRGDEAGLWISTKNDDKIENKLLSKDAGGKLLSWSPNSAKIAYTSTEGDLYVAYVLEQQVFKIADASIVDILWSKDSNSLFYILDGKNGESDSIWRVDIP